MRTNIKNRIQLFEKLFEIIYEYDITDIQNASVYSAARHATVPTPRCRCIYNIQCRLMPINTQTHANIVSSKQRNGERDCQSNRLFIIKSGIKFKC